MINLEVESILSTGHSDTVQICVTSKQYLGLSGIEKYETVKKINAENGGV